MPVDIRVGLHALLLQLVGVTMTLTRVPGLYKHTDAGVRKDLGTQFCEAPPLLLRGLGLCGDASRDTAGESLLKSKTLVEDSMLSLVVT